MSLKKLIKEKGFTQKIISFELCNTYKHYKYQQQVSSWCNGTTLPDVKSVYYLSKILGVTTDVIIESVMEVENEKC